VVNNIISWPALELGKGREEVAMEAREICRNCNLAGKDCCHTPHIIFIGISEAIKIHHETRLGYSEFLTYTNFDEEQFHEAFDELIPSGKTIALKQFPPDRRCVFFSSNGCTIPQLKPFICEVFPFWYDQEVYRDEGRIELIIEERDCGLQEAILKCGSIDAGCCLMQITAARVKHTFAQAFDHYLMARKFGCLFEKYGIDKAFEELEKRLLENVNGILLPTYRLLTH
jgi:Fe-S-cluster containining protein